MKKIFLFIALLAACFFSGLRTHAQSSVSEEDTRPSLEISKNIIKLISALAKDFADVKGDEITKTDDGTVVSGVKDMDAMQATNQYIMIKPGGAAYYVANYTGDSKKLTMSFAAFTGGIITLTNADGNFSVTHDTEKSSGTKLVYTMSVKGTKLGSYTMDTDTKEGTMIIGFL